MKEMLEKLAKGEVTVEEVLNEINELNKDMIPRHRLNEKIDEIKEMSNQLSERDKQLTELSKKAKGNEELQQTIDDLQKANNDATKEYETKLAEQKKQSQIELALVNAKAKNPKAVKALLNIEAISVDGDNLLGLEEQLKSLQEKEDYLFGEKEKLGGRDPHPPKPGEPITKNPFTKDNFNLTEQGQLIRNEPEKAKQLLLQAGKKPEQYGL